MCPACGKILSHVVTRPTRSTHDSHTFCERCTRLDDVLTRHDTFSRARPPNFFEHAQNFFSWPACEQRASWHVVARPKYVRGALATRRTSFVGVLHSLLTRWACWWSPNAGECNHIHYRVWSKINYPFSNRPNVTFSQRFHSALKRVLTLGMTSILFKYWIWNSFTWEYSSVIFSNEMICQ